MKDDPIGSVRLAALLAGALFLGAALAQSSGYPARAIRLVAGTAPGGITDYLARMSAEGLTALLGTQVVVENKAGATGNLAIEHVARSAPDGYTLLIVAGGNVVITPFLYGSLPFDPLHDIVPVFNVAGAPQLLIVSAGFDAHRLDPLAELNLETEDFAWLTEELLDLAGGRLVSALEGGYDLGALADSAAAHVRALMR